MNCLRSAECFDALRLVPRLLLFSYCWWVAYITDRLLNWYMALPVAAQTAQASAFCFGAITAITGVGGYVFKIYSESSRDWGKEGNRTSTMVATETVSK